MKQRKHGLLTVTLTGMLISRMAVANPVGGVVTGGDANALIIGQGTSQTTINQHADRVVIRWDQFSIAAGEVTTFVQPSSTAAALNLVNSSANPTTIFGSLQANGNVLLLNPNGILVGAGGVVDTGGFLASTLNVNESDFLAGHDLRFSGSSSAGVVNQGRINARNGDLFLIAPKVDNQGTLGALGGTVGIAAGSDVRLVQSGAERIAVLAGSASAGGGTGINNSGTIQAASAELKAAGGNIYALAINNGGVIRATTMSDEGGVIVIKSDGGNIANSGTLDASGNTGGSVTVSGGHNATDPATVISSGNILATGSTGRGGSVQVLGDHVGLFGDALVDVSGQTGGGTALIGGDFQGRNAAVQNAQATIVGSGATINANAVGNGNGGRVIVWADGSTRYYGNLSAQGGANGGNGGFAEVSGKGSLDFQGGVDLTATYGALGTLLLDPKFIYITTNAPSGALGSQNFTDNSTGTNVLSAASINTALGGANVILQANTDIVMSNGVAISGGTDRDLTLQAGRSIILSNGVSITLAGNGAFSATVNDENADAANRDAGPAQFFMASDASITAHRGITIRSGSLAFVSDGAGGSNSVSLADNVGNFTINNLTSGYATSTNNGDGLHAGSIAITNGVGNITVLGTLLASGQTTTDTGGGLNVGGNAGAITLVAGGGISAGNARVFANGGNGEDGGYASNVTMSAGSGISIGLISAVAGTGGVGTDGTVLLHATNGGVAQLSGGISAGRLVLRGSGDFILTRTNTVGTIAANVNGAVNYTNVSGLTIGTVSGTVGVSSGSNAISVATVNGDLTVSENVNAGTHTVSLTSGSSGNNNTLNVASGVDVTGTGGVTLVADDMTITGNILAGSSTVTLAPSESGTTISLGGTGSTLALSTNELANIQAGTLHIGSSAAGNITVEDQLDFTKNVVLQTGGGIALGANDLTATNFSVTLDHAGAVSGTGTIAADTLRLQGAGDVGTSPAYIHTRVGTVALNKAGGNVFVTNSAAVNLEGTTLGSLNVRAAGNITQTNALIVVGTTLLEAASSDVTLTNGQNNFTSVGLVANNAYLTDSNGISLGLSTVTGDLSVTAGGDISQTGALSVGGNTALRVTGPGGSNIILSNANNFAGSLSVTGALNNLAIRNTSGTAQAPSGSVTVTNFTLIHNNAGIALGGITNVAGNLTLSAGGDITQTAAMSVGGATAMSVRGGSNIYLGTVGNVFVGQVTATNNSGTSINNIDLYNGATNAGASFAVGSATNLTLTYPNSGLSFGATRVASDMIVTAGGDISQSGALYVGGDASLTTTKGGANIDLASQPNNFGGGLNVVGTLNTLAIRNTNGSAVAPSGAYTLTNLTLIHDNASIALGNITNVIGDLTLSAGGDITQANALSVGGATALSVKSGASIYLGTNGNVFMGAVTATTNSGNGSINTLELYNGATNGSVSFAVSAVTNLTLTYPNAGLSFGTTRVANNLTATAGGDISQTGALYVGGDAALTTTKDGASILLADQPNNFGGGLNVTGPVAGALSTLAIRNTNNLASAPTGAYALTNLTLIHDNAAIALGSITNVIGDLSLTAGGDITQTSSLTVGGATTLRATNHNVTLDMVDNDFKGAVAVAADNASLTDANDLTLVSSRLSGNLTVTALGTGSASLSDVAVTNNLAVSAGSMAVLTAVHAGGNEQVYTANGAINLTSNSVAGNLTAVSTNSSVNVFQSSVGTDATLKALASNIYVDGLSVGQDLSEQAGGPSGNGRITNNNVTVGRDLNATSANDLVSLAGVTVGHDAVVHAGTDITLDTVHVTNNLSATALGGGITGSGVVTVGGAATLGATNGNVTLANTANDFNTVTLVAQNATLGDTNGLQFGSAAVVGDLNVTALNGDITSGGVVTVGNQATLRATNGNVTLANPTNNFYRVAVVAQNATLSDADFLYVNGPVIATNLTVSAANGAYVYDAQVGRDLTIRSGSSAQLYTFNQSSNRVGGNLSVLATNSLAYVANSFIGQDATVASGVSGTAQLISSQVAGSADVSGDSVFVNDSTIGQNLTATAATGDANVVGVGVGNDAIVTAALTTTLNGLSVGHDLTATSMGGSGITGLGVLTVGNQATLLATNGNVTLANTANDFNKVTVVAANATLVDTNSVQFTEATVTGDLNVTALTGDITGGGVIKVENQATLLAANGDVTLANPANDFNTVVVHAVNGTLVDTNTVAVAAPVTTGNLAVTAGTTAYVYDAQVNGDLTIHAGNSAQLYVVALPTNMVGQNLTLIATNTTADAANVRVGGNAVVTSLNGGAYLQNSLILQDASVAGGLTAQINNTVVANDATVTAVQDVTLSDATVGHDLAATSANGNISGSGAVRVGNQATLLAANGDVTLVNAANDFNAVTVAATNATLVDANGLQLTGVTVTSNLNVTALNGDIMGGGVVRVGNQATLLAANGDVTLANAANDFNTVTTVAANATLVDANSVQFTGATVTGNLSVTALNGDITGGGAVAVGNAATLLATNGNVTLANAANDFNTVTVHANNSSLADVDDVVLANMTLTSNLTVAAGGAIHGSGIQSVGGVADYTSTGAGVNGNMLLTNSANTFGSLRLISTNGSTIQVAEADGTLLHEVFATNGNVSIRSGGSISQGSGDTVQASGLALVATGSVTLTNANQINTLAIAAGAQVDMAVSNRSGTFLTIGTVDGVNGISTGDADVHIAADRVMVSSPIVTGGTNNVVSFQAYSATTSNDVFQIGGSTTNLLGSFFVSGLNNVTSQVVRIGNTNEFAASIHIASAIMMTNGSRVLSLKTRGGRITQNTSAGIQVNSLGLYANSILLNNTDPFCNDVRALAYGGTRAGVADVIFFYQVKGLIDFNQTIDGIQNTVPLDALDKIIDDCGKGLNRVDSGVYYIPAFTAQQLYLSSYGVEPTPLGEGGDEALLAAWGRRSIWTSYLMLPFVGYQEKQFRLEDVPNWIIKDDVEWQDAPIDHQAPAEPKPRAETPKTGANGG